MSSKGAAWQSAAEDDDAGGMVALIHHSGSGRSLPLTQSHFDHILDSVSDRDLRDKLSYVGTLNALAAMTKRK